MISFRGLKHITKHLFFLFQITGRWPSAEEQQQQQHPPPPPPLINRSLSPSCSTSRWPATEVSNLIRILTVKNVSSLHLKCIRVERFNSYNKRWEKSEDWLMFSKILVLRIEFMLMNLNYITVFLSVSRLFHSES